MFCRRPYDTLRSAIDQVLVLHTKLVDVGGLTPDSEDELNLPISSTDKRASWSRTRQSSSASVTTSSRHSLSKQMSNCSTIPEKVLNSIVESFLQPLGTTVSKLLLILNKTISFWEINCWEEYSKHDRNYMWYAEVTLLFFSCIFWEILFD